MGNQHDVGKPRLQPPKIYRREFAARHLQRGSVDLVVAKLMEGLGQSDLVEDFQNGRMHGVAPELTVKILVCLKQRDRHAPPRQQKGQHHAAGPSAYNATGGLLGFFALPDPGELFVR